MMGGLQEKLASGGFYLLRFHVKLVMLFYFSGNTSRWRQLPSLARVKDLERTAGLGHTTSQFCAPLHVNIGI
jgi:hypothetical protein